MWNLFDLDHSQEFNPVIVSSSYRFYESVLEFHEVFEGTLMSLYEIFSQSCLVETIRDQIESSLTLIGLEVEDSSNFADAGVGPGSAGVQDLSVFILYGGLTHGFQDVEGQFGNNGDDIAIDLDFHVFVSFT